MTTLLLVRHGESEANRGKFFAGQKDVPLLPSGEEQAALTAKYISETYTVRAVYASDLRRAYRTGETISETLGVPLKAHTGLREVYAGEWQGKTFDLLGRDYAESYSVWCKDIGNCRCLGGESIRELSERVLAACTEIAVAHDGETVVIATHATPIRALQCICSGRDMDEMKNVPWASNASVTEITYDNGKWSVLRASIDSHLSGKQSALPPNV